MLKHVKYPVMTGQERASGSEPVRRTAETAGPRDEEAVRRFVEQLALLFAAWGFPRMAGRVLFALMTAEGRGLTASDLARTLDASPAAISGAVRYLTQIGLLVREPVPGSRRDLYCVRDDAWYAGSVYKNGLFETIAAIGRPAIEALGGPQTAPGTRVADMLAFLEFLEREMLVLLDRWEKERPSAHGVVPSAD